MYWERAWGVDPKQLLCGWATHVLSIAAPTFFPPYKLDTAHYTAEGYYALVDGGVFVNNPASLAMMEAMISYKREKAKELLRTETLVVSLGTGSLTRQYSYKKAKNWGQIQWALPILNVVMDGQSEGVAYQLNDLMVSEGDHRNYYRFQLPLTSDDQHDHMDNASPENLEYLSKRGRRLIEQEQESLNELCDKLLQDKGERSSWQPFNGNRYTPTVGARKERV